MITTIYNKVLVTVDNREDIKDNIPIRDVCTAIDFCYASFLFSCYKEDDKTVSIFHDENRAAITREDDSEWGDYYHGIVFCDNPEYASFSVPEEFDNE